VLGLETWLAQGRQALAEDLRRELEACPRCARELAELLALQATLEHSAAGEREALEAAQLETGPEDERRVRALFRRAVAPDLGDPRSLVGPVLGALVIAAAVLLFLVPVAGRRPRPGPPLEVELGPRRIELLQPIGPAADFGTFRWRDAAPAQGGHRVTIRAAGGGPELLHRDCTQPELVLDPETTRAWPPRIAWTVQALDAGRRAIPGALASGEAWLGPR
jgi:hypothetical protein